MNISRGLPQRELTGGLRVVPNVAADLIAANAYIFQIIVNNVGASTATITIKDKATAAKDLLTAVPVDPGVPFVWVAPFGVKMTNGINWVSSVENALHAEVFGYYVG